MRSSSPTIETHELCLRHWAWLTSPTWCRNPGKLLQSLGKRRGSMVAHCGLWCALLLCALACLWSRCGHDFESSGPHGRGSGPTCFTVWERTGERTDSGVFPRGPPSLWVSYTSGVWAFEAPVCVFSTLLSRTWVHGADSVQQLSASWRGSGSGPTCLAVCELIDSGVFLRGPPSSWVSYAAGVWACEAPVYVSSILLSRTWVHGADSMQQLSVSGRGSGSTCLTVWELTDSGVFPSGPPSSWVSYAAGVWACEAPVCGADSVQQLSVSGRGSGPTCLTVWELTDTGVSREDLGRYGYRIHLGLGVWSPCVYIFHIISTWVHGANIVQLSVSGRGRLLVHMVLVTVTGTTVSSSYPNNNLTMDSELERKRTTCKAWATRSANSLKDYLQRDDITKIKLGELISDFDKRLEALDCVQTQVEMSIEDLDALLADIEVSGNYRDSICETRLKAFEYFEKLSVTNPLEADVTNVTSTGTDDIKLPKLSLPKFSGDVLQWQSFWDQFTAVVDSSDIPDTSKISYLHSLLEGEVKQSIQGLSLTSQHYQSARKILTDRFGRKERIIFTHIPPLLIMPVMKNFSVSNLWKLNDDFQSHTRSLEALGICGTQYGVILTPLILSRLPQDVRLEWSRGRGRPWKWPFIPVKISGKGNFEAWEITSL